MHIYCLQLDIVWENKAPNHGRVLSLLEETRPEAGSLVVLPEMFATGFSMNVDKITDSQSRETQSFLAEVASRFEVFLLAGIVTTASSGRGRNESVVYGPNGAEVARYAKMQPFTLGGESANYEAGEGACLFPWNGFQVAPFICYDLRFPELFRGAVRRGANLYTVIASWPIARITHWVTLLRARAIENQAYVAGVNRCGRDPFFIYPGRSMIVDPRGEIIAECGDEEGAISAKLDLTALMDYRHELPFLKDHKHSYVRDVAASRAD
jgi:predicted amidohydrolase